MALSGFRNVKQGIVVLECKGDALKKETSCNIVGQDATVA